MLMALLGFIPGVSDIGDWAQNPLIAQKGLSLVSGCLQLNNIQSMKKQALIAHYFFFFLRPLRFLKIIEDSPTFNIKIFYNIFELQRWLSS